MGRDSAVETERFPQGVSARAVNWSRLFQSSYNVALQCLDTFFCDCSNGNIISVVRRQIYARSLFSRAKWNGSIFFFFTLLFGPASQVCYSFCYFRRQHRYHRTSLRNRYVIQPQPSFYTDECFLRHDFSSLNFRLAPHVTKHVVTRHVVQRHSFFTRATTNYARVATSVKTHPDKGRRELIVRAGTQEMRSLSPLTRSDRQKLEI